MPLPIYTIQINGKYFKGISDETVGKTGDRNKWYAQARELYRLDFTDDVNEAKLAEGNSNLNSYLKKLYEHIYAKTIEVDEILIKKIGEE